MSKDKKDKEVDPNAIHMSFDAGVKGGWSAFYETARKEENHPVAQGTLLKTKTHSSYVKKDEIVMFLGLEELQLTTTMNFEWLVDENELTDEEKQDIQQLQKKTPEPETRYSYYARVLHGEQVKNIGISNPDDFFKHFEVAQENKKK